MFLRLILFTCLGLTASAEESHWAYTAPKAQEVPPSAHLVDHLLAAAWKENDLAPNPLAPANRWLERAAYTLTGLPPTSEQLKRLAATPDDTTWRALIDELLASSTYGERWARHWMDVARYADTWGYNFQKDNRYPHAYTYRDWLISAFNDDLPYDQFVKLQVAADHLVDRPDHPHHAALGFLTVGPRHGGVEKLDDRVDVITRGFLSTTVSCARCHDHKTDPLTQEDYYSFYSILENTIEEQPVIGKPANENASADFEAKEAKLLHENHIARHKIVETIRSADSIANILEIAWLGRKHNWPSQKITTEGYNRGLLRSRAINKWLKFLNQRAWGKNPSPRLAKWVAEMETAAEPMALCRALSHEWAASLDKENGLGKLARNPHCPLSYDVHRIGEFFNQSDGNEQRERDGALARLQGSHAGAPPRAMALRDRDNWAPAKIYIRGNPADRSEPFQRHWPTVLGGQPYPEGKSPRLTMAEWLADRTNPLTARVMVNRVWAWHFGAPLADPGDFGPQQTAPALLPLLDTLAVWFMDHGWSVKELHRLLLTSRAFRLQPTSSAHNESIDEANSLFWRWNRQRLDFESARDRLLQSSGTLQLTKLGGRSVDLSLPSSNPRRSLYAFLDRYALPGLFVNFDVPHPDHHAPRRIQTTVPQQALYFLNNILPIEEAKKLARNPAFVKLTNRKAKITWLYQRIHRRAPSEPEMLDALNWINLGSPEDYAPPLAGHWKVGYRHDSADPASALTSFPMFEGGTWRTGKDLSKAPIPYLYAGPNNGHAAHQHSLVLRWVAHGAGQVRMAGSIRRTQKGGSTLSFHLVGPDGKAIRETTLPPESHLPIKGSEITVKPGDTLDFVLRAPNGATCGTVDWNLILHGKESPDDHEREITRFRRDFPKSNTSPTLPGPTSPWPDLIQILWASNEFHFID